MNQRIKELLAELDIDLYTDEGEMMTKILVRPKDLRQFAELIVQKCMSFQDEVGVYSKFDMADAIAQHFGVKE